MNTLINMTNINLANITGKVLPGKVLKPHDLFSLPLSRLPPPTVVSVLVSL